MEAILERLKQEKHESEVNYRKEGREAGITWANSANYRELKRSMAKKDAIVDFYDRYGGIPYTGIEISKNIHEYITGIFATDPLLDNCVNGAGLVLGSCLSEEATEWFLGWLEGVEEIWIRVANKL